MNINIDQWTGELHQEFLLRHVAHSWSEVTEIIKMIIEAGDLANVLNDDDMKLKNVN